MRRTGVVRSARGLEPGDHVCWGFRSPAELGGLVRDLVADAARVGDRFTYLGDRPSPELLHDVGRWVGATDRLDEGLFEAISYRELPDEERRDPVGLFSSALQRALDAGFRGLRLLADSTSVVRSDQRRAEYLGWEHVADGHIAGSQLCCVCAYDRRELGAAAVSELAAAHPLVSDRVLVQVLSAPDADLALMGDLDAASVGLLELMLDRIVPSVDDGRLVVDASRVGFMDAQSLRMLDRYARRRGTCFELRRPPSSAVRVLELVPLEHVRTGPG